MTPIQETLLMLSFGLFLIFVAVVLVIVAAHQMYRRPWLSWMLICMLLAAIILGWGFSIHHDIVARRSFEKMQPVEKAPKSD